MITINKQSISFNVDENSGKNGDWDFWKHVTNDSWEPHTFNIFSKFLDKQHSYLDIGSWIGPTVLFGSQLSKTCYAFEPDPIAFNHLENNISLNPDISNIICFKQAISGTNGTKLMGTNSNQGDSMSSLLFSNNSWVVDSLTLEECFNKYDIKDCNFIKIDVEGGEELIINSSVNFIKNNNFTVYIALHIPWLINKKQFFNNLTESFSNYKYIYSINGDILQLKDLHKLTGFIEILATNVEWKK